MPGKPSSRQGSPSGNGFLDAVDAPLGLRIPDFELSLADLLVVLAGSDGGRNREWFANHWPAAAATVLRAGGRE